jgi:hypothetical protein
MSCIKGFVENVSQLPHCVNVFHLYISLLYMISQEVVSNFYVFCSPKKDWILGHIDRAGMPDLSVRWIILIGGGGDSRDPTTNKTDRGALAIAEPTPNGY